ncbi:xylan 1,4-beta-xylosidase [Edaphobacter aggregans]|jgi:xylan 1,4-beta-xylosidase|uniref:Xylan 1,4-beta-xylosidase n=1 Tax=Edaphobacter aggregans TaxID=570835 RepID=A0A3R9QD74_9BACT|nr:beta-xylosidase [Edaphobacter aggregans]RSL18486.1 xylan 1,4-beta-xylosidase [Edaphobacter aggregans]
MRKFALTLICAAAMQAAAQAPISNPVSIQVDLAKPQGPYKPIYSWFGYDESNYTTMRYGKQLLTELHDLSPVPVYIRAHHLLTSGNGVAELKWSSSNVFTLDANGKPVYDFTITDQTFDEFQKAGVRPMVELGFMPKDLAATVPGVDAYQVHYPNSTISGASNNPPKDYAMWSELVQKYTEHLVERYGKEQVRTWYFEVWNEPDIPYWHATPEEYNKLYDYSVAGVRAALPDAIVGGPASTGPASDKAEAFLDNFLKHCLNDKSAANGKAIPLDFISFHPKGRPTVVDGHVRMGLANELKAAGNGFRVVAKYPKYIHLPIILSEADPEGCAACSMKVNPSNAYRNGPLYPTYTAAAIKALFELQDRYKVNLISMLSWSFEFEDKEYFEGFRTLATNGVDKPVLNVFRMAGLMSGERVNTSSTGQVSLDDILNTGVKQTPDIDAFATKGDHEAAVMLWNYHDDDVPAEGAPLQVTIGSIPTGVKKVLLEHYRIDNTHSNSYTVWKAMGSPQAPTAEQYARLKEAGHLELLRSPEWLDVKDGKVTIATELPRQATSLMRLKW